MFSFFRALIPVAHAQDYTDELDSAGAAVYGSAEAASVQADLPSMIGVVIGAFLSILGIYLLYLFLRSGYLWMTAQGNSKQVDDAKTTMVNAVIGLVIITAAYAITGFVIDSLGTLAY